MRAGRNLLGRLIERSPAELGRIAACWDAPLSGRTHRDNVARLYATMRDIWAVRDRAAALSPAEWAVVEALEAAHEADDEAARTTVELAGATGLGEEEAAGALAALEACGIAYREPRPARVGEEPAPAYFLARELATAFQRVREERILGPALTTEAPLRALLTTLEPGELEQAAETWGLRVTPGVLPPATLTDELLARVALPEQRRAVAADLPPVASRVFAALRQHGEPLPVAALRERLKLDPPAFREAARLLAARLLVWHAYLDGERVLFIPRDVLAPRRATRDAPPDLVPVDAVPDERPHHPYSAAWDLLTILRRLTLGTLEWREGDEERNATHLRRLAPALWLARGGRPRPGYVPFLLALARDEGLVRVEDDELVPAAAIDAWRDRTLKEQTRLLFERWRATRGWPEGLGHDDLQLTGVDWPAMRQAVLAEVRTLRVGAWHDAATLALRIARLRPTLLGGSFSAARASGPAGTRDEVTAAAVGVALRGGLVPLGALAEGDAGTPRAPRPALALTELGGWLLGLRPDFSPPPLSDRALTVNADFEILLFRPTPRRLWALGAIAELVRLDTVSVWRLTAGSVARGVASGLTLEQIATFLERAAGAPLPQPVRYSLDEWTRGQDVVRLSRALILRLDRADDAATARLAAAVADAGLRPPESLPGGRYLVAVPGDDAADRLADLLQAAGFTAHWSKTPGEPWEPRRGG